MISVLLVYVICLVFRFFEYFFIRTDYSVLGEAVVHKILGIIIFCLAVHIFNYDYKKTVFFSVSWKKKLSAGIVFGSICFAIAYFTEIIILTKTNSFDNLAFYVTSYSVNGNFGNRAELIFFAICILGNIINVLMEEGIFRGLFLTRLQGKYSFVLSAIISSALFGLWHCTAPLRSFIDGESSSFQLLMNCLILVLSSALVGFKFCMLTKITGSVYMSMGGTFCK